MKEIPEICGSAKAPVGWSCTRSYGHDGPCAAMPVPIPNDPPVCQSCDSEYNLRDGYDVSKYCDECAQRLVGELEAELTSLREREQKFREELEHTDEWLMKHPRPSPWNTDEAGRAYVYALEDRVRWLNVGIDCHRQDRKGLMETIGAKQKLLDEAESNRVAKMEGR